MNEMEEFGQFLAVTRGVPQMPQRHLSTFDNWGDRQNLREYVHDEMIRPVSRGSLNDNYFDEQRGRQMNTDSVFDRIRFPNEMQDSSPPPRMHNSGVRGGRSWRGAERPSSRSSRQYSSAGYSRRHSMARGDSSEMQQLQGRRRNETVPSRIRKRVIRAKRPFPPENAELSPISDDNNIPIPISPSEAYGPHSIAISVSPSPEPHESAEHHLRPISASTNSGSSVIILDEDEEEEGRSERTQRTDSRSRSRTSSQNRSGSREGYNSRGYSNSNDSREYGIGHQRCNSAAAAAVQYASRMPMQMNQQQERGQEMSHQFPFFSHPSLPLNPNAWNLAPFAQAQPAFFNARDDGSERFDPSQMMQFGGFNLQNPMFTRMDASTSSFHQNDPNFVTPDNLLITIRNNEANAFDEIREFPPESIDFDSDEEKQNQLSERAKLVIGDERERDRKSERGERSRDDRREREHYRDDRKRSRRSKSRSRERKRSRSRESRDRTNRRRSHSREHRSSRREKTIKSEPVKENADISRKSELSERQSIELEQNENFFDGLAAVICAPIERVAIPSQSGFDLSIGFRGVPPFMLHAKVYAEPHKKVAEYKVYNDLMQCMVSLLLIPADFYIDFYSYKALPGMLVTKLTPLLKYLLEDNLKEHVTHLFGVPTFTEVSIAECQNWVRQMATAFWNQEQQAFQASISGMKKDILTAITTPHPEEKRKDADRSNEKRPRRRDEDNEKEDGDRGRERKEKYKKRGMSREEELSHNSNSSTAIQQQQQHKMRSSGPKSTPTSSQELSKSEVVSRSHRKDDRRRSRERGSRRRSRSRSHSRNSRSRDRGRGRHPSGSHGSSSFLRKASAFLNAPLASSMPFCTPSSFPRTPSDIPASYIPASIFPPADFSVPPPLFPPSIAATQQPPTSSSTPYFRDVLGPPGVDLPQPHSSSISLLPIPGAYTSVKKPDDKAAGKGKDLPPTTSSSSVKKKPSDSLHLDRKVAAGEKPSDAFAYKPPENVALRKKPPPNHESDLLDLVFTTSTPSKRK
ncbi:hypothetical protein WR25_11913 [Diploscapter pachys]|uniref:Uncharacterized protein n=1 Tax=Diploscapter pachys TaxID=2018661 RepID=A0A2A2KCF5_9BILA|nr:hypothetical protein WR25_11913 [Diploscapter pachys]